MAKRWLINPHDQQRIAQLEKAAAIPPVVAHLLTCRGIHDAATARHFLDAKLSGLRDPEELPGISSAADRVHQAIVKRQQIVIYGDYDADGMTATAILYCCLRMLHADVIYHVPNRLDDGYGLNRTALTTLAERGAAMVITVDCGIASLAEAEVARELGLELIVTDHHEMAETLPAAAAIVHPRLPGHSYPFSGLCGAGVAFKLAWALCQRASDAKKVSPPMREFLLVAVGLAALGTVADVVPLLDENRILVRHGLSSLRQRPVPGIAALIRVAGLAEKAALASEDIAFSIAPRLNAAGRLGQAALGVELLTTDSQDRAVALAEYLHELNAQRDTIERRIYLAADKQIKQQHDAEGDPAFVLAGRGWHPGVIGIVAGRLAEKYQRPTILIALDELGVKPGSGSARSSCGLPLHEALQACGPRLLTHGGHAAAAGLSVEEGQVDAFRSEFCEYAASHITDEDRIAQIQIDVEAPFSQLNLRTVQQIEQLAPFGLDNPRPLLCTSEVVLAEPPRTMGGGDRHLSLKIKHQQVTLRAVAFGRAEWRDELNELEGPFDVAYHPVINEYRGRRSVELHLVDWRRTASPVLSGPADATH